MGAAGDMLTASLLELMPDKDKVIDELNQIGIPSVEISAERSEKCGIRGSHIHVIVDGDEETVCEHHHVHRHMHDIEEIIDGLRIPDKVRKNVKNVYRLIADAESSVHGVPVADIHFHEVGTMDAISDITCFCYLIDKLSPDKVIVSPICTGSGQVHCAHGILPVPAPATAYILRNVPIYSGEIKSELCTPTGAALLKYHADDFGSMPVMKIDKIGYGMGQKDFESANCVRVFIGEKADTILDNDKHIDHDIRQKSEKKDDMRNAGDMIVELSCNVDDMTAEEISFAIEKFFESGAAEVFTVPVGMKKSRLGTLIEVLCHKGDIDKMVRAIFKYTSTIGIRESECRRYILDRTMTETDTSVGKVHRKISTGYGVTREKIEYDDLSRIASEQGVTIAEARKMADTNLTIS